MVEVGEYFFKLASDLDDDEYLVDYYIVTHVNKDETYTLLDVKRLHYEWLPVTLEEACSTLPNTTIADIEGVMTMEIKGDYRNRSSNYKGKMIDNNNMKIPLYLDNRRRINLFRVNSIPPRKYEAVGNIGITTMEQDVIDFILDF